MHLRGAENIGESITMMDLHKAGLTALGPKGMSPSLLVANLWIWRGRGEPRRLVLPLSRPQAAAHNVSYVKKVCKMEPHRT